MSFLRGLRVLRAKLRRSDAGNAKCRSLDSLRSLGMTVMLRSRERMGSESMGSESSDSDPIDSDSHDEFPHSLRKWQV